MRITSPSPTFTGYILSLLYVCGIKPDEYTVTKDGFEIHNIEGLKNGGKMVVQIAREIEEKRKGKKDQTPFIIPLTAKNEKRSYQEKILKELNIQNDAPISDVLEKYFRSMTEKTNDSTYTCPSCLAPEFYEFNRVLGYTESRRKSDKYKKLSFDGYMLGIAGYVTSYLDRVKITGNQFVEVHLLPNVEGAHPEITMNWVEMYKKLRFGIEGLTPVTSLLMWLSLKTNYRGTVQLIALNTGWGQNPTTIWNAFNLDLTRTSEIFSELEENYKKMLERLLIDVFNQTVTNNFAIKISQLIFEAINRTKPLEELLYVGSREGALVTIKEVLGLQIAQEERKYLEYSRVVKHLFHILRKKT